MGSTLQHAVGVVTAFVPRWPRHGYQSVSTATQGDESEAEGGQVVLGYRVRKMPHGSPVRRASVLILLLLAAVLLAYSMLLSSSNSNSSCDSVDDGYQCKDTISHFWGQYSPYFLVKSDISANVPENCEITFAQILSRHGARDPTAGKSEKYRELIDRIHRDAKKYPSQFGFLKTYQYTLGADQLTVFGEQEMVNSGIKYYHRYHALAKDAVPFIRSAGQERVVQSAVNWTQGFHMARVADEAAVVPDQYPYHIVIINEGDTFNNTLSHDTCKSYNTSIAATAKETWATIFTPPITKRINRSLKGVKLNMEDTISLMDMCPFDTVASPTGAISPFCNFFSAENWADFDYYQSLDKYYGYGMGNPLGPTQGVGFVNELIARLSRSPVVDHTNTNSTLDNSEKTFPLNDKTKLYADFSHDNDMTNIFASFGLFNATKPLSTTQRQSVVETAGFSASWTVPFSSRAYFEKMKCEGEDEEFVRVLLNDRVIPLETCDGDVLGRCTLSNFLKSLSFARNGGDWDKCFI